MAKMPGREVIKNAINALVDAGKKAEASELEFVSGELDKVFLYHDSGACPDHDCMDCYAIACDARAVWLGLEDTNG